MTSPSVDSEPAAPPATRVIAALFGLSLLARLYQLAFGQPFGWDEIEFARATRFVADGLLPFRDFWEHHTPLQWLLFAPVAAIDRPGLCTITLLRLAQLPLWLASFACMYVWARDDRRNSLAVWTAIACVFAGNTVQYDALVFRVDVLANSLFVAALVAMRRRSRGAAFVAGGLFALAVFANIRLAPVVAVAVALVFVIDIDETSWRFQPGALRIVAGGVVTTVIAAAWAFATGVARPFWQQVIRENYLGDLHATQQSGAFLGRLLVPFGVHRLPNAWAWAAGTFDPAGAIAMIGGAIGLVVALRRIRRPDALVLLALVQLAGLAFVARMKYVYTYHLLLTALLAIPLFAIALERFVLPRALVPLAVVVSLFGVACALGHNGEVDRQYQDAFIRELDARVPAGAAVFEGVGMALHHKPAYRFWFLPMLALELVQHGYVAPYHVRDVVAAPPAAIVLDYRAGFWLVRNPNLRAFLTAHYFPVARGIWLPGLSARIGGTQRSAEWIVLADGNYRVIASEALASHGWFANALISGTYPGRDANTLTIDTAALPPAHAPLTFFANGQPVAPVSGHLALRRGQRLRAETVSDVPVGLLLLPYEDRFVLRQPPVYASFEAGAILREWHLPFPPDPFAGSVR